MPPIKYSHSSTLLLSSAQYYPKTVVDTRILPTSIHGGDYGGTRFDLGLPTGSDPVCLGPGLPHSRLGYNRQAKRPRGSLATCHVPLFLSISIIMEQDTVEGERLRTTLARRGIPSTCYDDVCGTRSDHGCICRR